jgi:FdhD protein
MIKEQKIIRYEYHKFTTKIDLIAKEVQFTMFVNRKEIASFLCSPDDFKALAQGYLFSEGIIRNKKDIISIVFDELEYYINIDLNPRIAIEDYLEKKKVLTSGCGKGSFLYRSLTEIKQQKKKTENIFYLEVEKIITLVREFQKKSDIFLATGGVHSVGLCSNHEILFFKEDIGRHNAVDKVLGECFEQDVDLTNKALILSGRIAVEIVQKAVRAGIQILLSKSAPTTLAIELANEANLTLVGFIRGERMNIYTHSYRIIP